MRFMEAMQCVKEGKKVRRSKWSNMNFHIFSEEGDLYERECEGYEEETYSPDFDEIEADDWVIYGENKEMLFEDIKVGKILTTKDGRLTGNCLVIKIVPFTFGGSILICITDFGHTIDLTKEQCENQFYIEPHSCDYQSTKTRWLDQVNLLFKNMEDVVNV